jgi:hypothetical protein
MQRSVRLLFLIIISCVAFGCAHKAGPQVTASQPQGQGAPAGPAVSGGVPSMELPEVSYDFGNVKDTEGEVVHEFKIKNVGTGVLEIKKVLPG